MVTSLILPCLLPAKCQLTASLAEWRLIFEKMTGVDTMTAALQRSVV